MDKFEKLDVAYRRAMKRVSPSMRPLLVRSHALVDQIASACRDKNKPLANKLTLRSVKLFMDMIELGQKEMRDGENQE